MPGTFDSTSNNLISSPQTVSGPTNSFSKGMVAAIALLLTSALLVLVFRFHVSTDLDVFMPKAKTAAEELLLSQLDQGATSSLIFASLSEAESEQLAELNRSLAEKIRASELFVRVYNGEGGISPEDRDFIVEHRYLLTPDLLAQKFSQDALDDALNQRYQGLASATATFEKRYVRRDPTGELIALFDQWQNKQVRRELGPENLFGVWFSRDHERSLMVVEMATGGLDFGAQEQAVKFIEQSFAETNTVNARINLTGSAAFAVESRDTIWGDVGLLTLLAVSLIGAFLYAVFRSFALMLLLTLPLLCAVIVAVASVIILFGNIHGVTLAFGVTLTGVAIDYPIHVFAHLDGRRENVENQIKRIWPTLRLGVVTTVLAYSVFVVSEFEGLKQLGVFTIAGLLTAAAVTRWLLPVVMPRRLPEITGLHGLHEQMQKAGVFASRLKVFALGLLAIAAIYLLITDKPLRNLDVDSLSPISTERRADGHQVREDLGFWSGGQLVIVAADTSEQALVRSEKLRESLNQLVTEGAIADYDMAAQFLPSQQRQQQQQQAIPDIKTLRERIVSAQKNLPFRPGTFEPFLEEIEKVRVQNPVTIEEIGGLEIGARLGALLFQHDNKWLAPVLLHGVKDVGQVKKLDAHEDGTQVTYLHIKQESTRVVTRAIDQVMQLLLVGAVIIYLILTFSFKSLTRPLTVLGPTIGSVVIVGALLVAFDTSLSLFHFMSLLLVIGLGLDYSLFFNRLREHGEEWATTFKAIWVSCFTTVLVFALLLISNTPPLQAVGQTVACGAILCLILGAIWATVALKPEN